jgi:pyruvate/2-oxoglutarate dehydrogenase complex dihydrolipoamide acyltransferase (E2) component
MDGATRTGSNIGALSTSWSVERIADYGGDGRADILIRNSSGQLYLFEMNGNTRTGSNIGALSTTWAVEVQ